MSIDFFKTYQLDESILDDITAADNKKSAEVLAKKGDVKIPDQLVDDYSYIFCLRFSGYNLKMLEQYIVSLRNFMTHINAFFENQRIVKDYIVLKPVIVRWKKENHEDGRDPGEYDDYIIFTEDTQSHFWTMPPTTSRSYRVNIYFAVNFSKLTTRSLIRFIYQSAKIEKLYFPNSFCSYNVSRTPICPYNVTGQIEDGHQDFIMTNTRFINELYDSHTNKKYDTNRFKENDFQQFRRFLTFIAPDLKLDIAIELSQTVSDYALYKQKLLQWSLSSWLKRAYGCPPNEKSKKLSQTAKMKRTFSLFKVDGSTLENSSRVMFGCKMLNDRSIDSLSTIFYLFSTDPFNRGNNDKRRDAVMKQLKENPVSFSSYYDFRFVDVSSDEHYVVFCGYAGFVQNGDEIFELIIVVGAYLDGADDDKTIRDYAHHLSQLFGDNISPNEIYSSINKTYISSNES